MAKFKDKWIAALRPKSERYERWEGGGFGVRVSPGGGKAWVWVYRFDGRPRRMTLGTYPKLGLADARIKIGRSSEAFGPRHRSRADRRPEPQG
jgi:hypothetical protein